MYRIALAIIVIAPLLAEIAAQTTRPKPAAYSSPAAAKAPGEAVKVTPPPVRNRPRVVASPQPIPMQAPGFDPKPTLSTTPMDERLPSEPDVSS